MLENWFVLNSNLSQGCLSQQVSTVYVNNRVSVHSEVSQLLCLMMLPISTGTEVGSHFHNNNLFKMAEYHNLRGQITMDSHSHKQGSTVCT